MDEKLLQLEAEREKREAQHRCVPTSCRSWDRVYTPYLLLDQAHRSIQRCAMVLPSRVSPSVNNCALCFFEHYGYSIWTPEAQGIKRNTFS